METREIKDINLLYTHWDGDIALANGNELGYEHTIFNDFSNFISTHLNNNQFVDETRYIKIKKKGLYNYNTNDTFFYCISHPSLSLSEMVEIKLPINPEVIELSKRFNNIYFIFSCEHEADTEDVWPNLIKLISKNKLDESKFNIINNDSNIYEQLNEYDCGINVHKCNFIRYSSYEVFSNLDISFKENKEGKFFMCRNRTSKLHRISLIIQLHLRKIIDNINYSYIPENWTRLSNYANLVKYNKISELKAHRNFIEKIISHSKIDDYEVKKNWINPDTNEFQGDQPPIFRIPELTESFENSYFNIITESMFDSRGNSVHASEKSYRPFVYYQFAIYLATPYHVKYLRDCGFDMFDDIIDHGYDHEVNDSKRFNMVVDEIVRINDKKDFFKQFYIENKDRFIKNNKLHKKLSTEGQILDLDFIWNML